MRNKQKYLPERDLMVAVLRRAMDDFRGICATKKIQAGARRWFEAPLNYKELYNFENICDELGYDSGKVKEYLGVK
jgi:hypothetical protein